MNRREKIDRIEAAAQSDIGTGAQGLYTPDIVSGMEPSRLAATLNAYVARLNIDAISEAKRKARRLALSIFTVGVVVGATLTYFAVAVWMNPVRELLQHLPVTK